MNSFTIITTEFVVTTEASHWAKDDGDLYVYDDEETVLHVPEMMLIGVGKTDAVQIN